MRPNGSGKTTSIRMMLDLIRPTTGKGTVLGLDSRTDATEIRRRVDYLPGDITLYDRMSGHNLIRYLANLRGGVDWDYMMQLTRRFDCDLRARIGTLSRGNRRKMGLIHAVMSRHELLIMAEPTAGFEQLMQQ